MEKGQTLYAISKIYNLSVDDLKKWNKMTSNELEVGTSLSISSTSAYAKNPNIPVSVSAAKKEESTVDKNARFHTVVKGETLFSVAKKYPATMNDISEWNNLTSPTLDVGQLLVVKKASNSSAMESLNSVNTAEKTKAIDDTRQPVKTTNTSSVVKPDDVNEALAATEKMLHEHTKAVKTYEKAVANGTAGRSNANGGRDGDFHKVPSNLTTYEDSLKYGAKGIRRNVGKFNKTEETGICEMIRDNHWDSKYNALHSTAEKGTIIQIENIETGISVMVKVVGRLAAHAETPNLIIRISHHADERLAHGKDHFPVKITYLP